MQTTATEKTTTKLKVYGTSAEGKVLQIWDENIAPYGQYGVCTSVAYVENTTHEPLFTGFQYTICKSTKEGTINGGLVQVCGEQFISWTGATFYDNDIPFDDDIPFR